eukprot:748265-Hanusia_phi.AAC.3
MRMKDEDRWPTPGGRTAKERDDSEIVQLGRERGGRESGRGRKWQESNNVSISQFTSFTFLSSSS